MVTEVELQVVFYMKKNKVTSTDDFPVEFFQKLQFIVKQELRMQLRN